MSKTTSTIQVHTSYPVSADASHDHVYQNVDHIEVTNGHLYVMGTDDTTIAQYQKHAWASWNVVSQNNNSAEDRFTSHSKSASAIGFRDDTGKLTALVTGDGLIDEETIQKRLDDEKNQLETRLDKIEETISKLNCNKHVTFHYAPASSAEEALKKIQENEERDAMNADYRRK